MNASEVHQPKMISYKIIIILIAIRGKRSNVRVALMRLINLDLTPVNAPSEPPELAPKVE